MRGQEDKIRFCRHRSGFALIFVIVILVVLTAIVYRMSYSISRWKHRQQYVIDYQTARYACESGLKYAMVTANNLTPAYISRPNEPDFSDLFNMSDEEYKKMMEDWAQKLGMEVDANGLNKSDFTTNFMNFSSLFDTNETNSLGGADFNSRSLFGPNDINGIGDFNAVSQNPGKLVVPGPYGPPWPYVAEPIEIEFGDARIEIEIIDENAKLPLSWGISSDPNVKRETKAAVVTFCEWMQMEPNEIGPLLAQLEAVKEIKPFSLNLKPVVTVAAQQTPADSQQDDANATKDPRSRRITARRARTTRARSRVVQETRPDIGHIRDFAKLMHSPMIDLEKLAKPVNEDENRSESALKYISLWGTGQVNINTAPRQVLEAAFTFGGDAADIAEQIIKLRKTEPFKDIDDLKKKLFSYTDSIEKSRPYITTQSDCFSIRVKATSGVARVCATAGIKKEENGFQRIGIIVE
jgi:hypothetical protein